MDVGKCNDRYFINGMGLGIDAQVAYENYRGKKESAILSGKNPNTSGM
jgi:diacylglycerol kinase family enzyme